MAVLIAGWVLQIDAVDLKKLGNVSMIVIGVALASFGEIDFVLTGFLYQVGGIAFEAVRICLVQRLLNGAEFKMDPLVSLYYFAPVCAFMNFTVALIWEVPLVQMSEVYAVGLWTFFANACCAFFLNMSVVFLVCTLTLVLYTVLTRNARLAKPPASSSLSAVCSRISSLSRLPCSFGVPRSLASKPSDTPSLSAVWFTTSWVRRS